MYKIKCNIQFLIFFFLALAFSILYGGYVCNIFFCSLLIPTIFSIIFTFIFSKKIKYELNIKKKEYYVGEKIDFSMVLKNKSNIYIPYISIYEDDKKDFRNIMSVKKKEEKVIKENITFYKRGVYRIGMLNIEAKDLLGIITICKKIKINNEIIVYPKINYIECNNKFNIMNDKNSEFSNKIFPEESTIKKYEYKDKMKNINWKISAKLNDLYVKKYSNNVYNEILIIIDMNKNNYNFDKKGYIEEKLIESALSIINMLQNKNIRFEVWLLKKNMEKYFIENVSDYNNFNYEMIFKESDGNINIEKVVEFLNTKNDLMLFTIKLDKNFIDSLKYKISDSHKISIFYYISFDTEIDILQNFNINAFNIKEFFKEDSLDENLHEEFI